MQVTSDAQRGRWALAACFFVNGFVVGSWAPQIPVLVSRFSLSEAVLGLMIVICGIGAIVAMPVCGYLIGRFSSQAVLRVCGVLCALSLVGLAAAQSMGGLVVALLFLGAMMGGMDVAMNSNAVVVERRLGRAIMSSSHGFWSLGGFAGAGAGGFLVEHWGYIAHIAVAASLALVIVLAAMPALVRERRPVSAAGAGGGGFPRKPVVYLTGIVALLCMMPEGAVLDWAALYLIQEMGTDIGSASLAFTGFSGAMALMRFLGDGVRNRLGAVTTMRISGAVAAAGMLAAGLATTPVMAIVAFAFAGLGIANMVPIAFSAAGNQPGISSAAGMSVATTIGYSGMLAGPSLVGFTAERTGFAPTFIGFAVLLAMVLLTANIMKPADAIAPQPAQ